MDQLDLFEEEVPLANTWVRFGFHWMDHYALYNRFEVLAEGRGWRIVCKNVPC